MKFLRNNWYWIFSIVIGLGIGSIITMHRVQQQADELKQKMPKVAEQTPEVHKHPIHAGSRPTSDKTLRTIDPGNTGHNHPETPPPLPTDVLKRRDMMVRERVLAAGKDIWDWRDDGPHLTAEASQIELEALTGGMNPEEAIAYLEKHGYYNEAILSQVSAARAFEYLQTIRLYREANEYAKKALEEDPDNFEIKKHLLLSEKDNAKAAAGYREILAKNPNDVGALLNLGYRMHYDDPEGALVHLIKGNKLDPTLGFRAIGLAYERLGDVKTAWLYYRKHLTLWPRDPLVRSHLAWINIDEPKYPPIYLERQPVPQRDAEVIEKGGVVPKKNQTPAFEDTPWYPELPPDETHPDDTRQTDAEAARTAFEREFERQQAAAQKEFDEFMKWAEAVMDANAAMETNDFLTQELAAHLRGGETKVTPERLVRAFELMERHGRTRGLQRLKDTDPDLAAEVERLLEEKQQPSRHPNQQNKNK